MRPNNRYHVPLIIMLGSLLSLEFVTYSSYTETVFGIDYRAQLSSPGVLRTDTRIIIDSMADYIVDPLSDSSATATPSSASIAGYGWRTAQPAGLVIPSGTWAFTVVTESPPVSTGSATVAVYAYHADISGSGLSFIGTAQGADNVILLLGGTHTQTISFSVGSPVDLTDKVLIVEYWIIVEIAPLTSTTISFYTGDSTPRIELPTSPSLTTYYLGSTQAHSIGFEESLSVFESMNSAYHASRSIAEPVSISDFISIILAATRQPGEVLSVFDQITAQRGKTLLISESLSIADGTAASAVAGTSGTSGPATSTAGSRSRTAVSIGDYPTTLGAVAHLGKVLFQDESGRVIDILQGGQRFSLVGNIRNNQFDSLQPFVYIVQVADQQGHVVSIITAKGWLLPGETAKVAVQWQPNVAGVFDFKIFVWDSLERPRPLANALSIQQGISVVNGAFNTG